MRRPITAGIGRRHFDEQEGAFWESIVASAIGNHALVPWSRPERRVVVGAFAWDDLCVEVYRERLAEPNVAE